MPTPTSIDSSLLHQKYRLGDLLTKRGVITEDQLKVALTEQESGNKQLGQVLLQLGFATESVIRDALSEVLDAESIDLAHMSPDGEALAKLPRSKALQLNILPVSFDSARQTLTIAISDVYNLVAIDQLRSFLGGNVIIKPLLAGETEIQHAIDQLYGVELSVDGILDELETGEIDFQSLANEEGEYTQPVVRLINALLSDAVKRNASDVHFEPEQGFVRIRYRIDGVLRQIRSLHQRYWPAMTVRLKVLSSMNIAETRAPQDGRFSMTVAGRSVDFRSSVQPTTHGENFVLRILDRNRGIVALDDLELHPDSLTMLKLMLARPEGILLVTGPTGSGKTTTLYSMLNHVNNESVNIMTLEDPVEYPMMMLRQTSVNEAAKMDFASGIRSMMRQDPDVILVGEIRDKDTADMAMRAAMTGHQVFSTLHTNSAIGAIPRLLDLGVLPDVIAGNIIGIVAQRLIRVLCKNCKTSYTPSETELMLLGEPADTKLTLHQQVGCPVCQGVGYRGRMALMELLKFDGGLDDLVAQHRPTNELLRHALDKGFLPLAEDGVRRIKEGLTTIEEVARVVDMTQRLM